MANQWGGQSGTPDMLKAPMMPDAFDASADTRQAAEWRLMVAEPSFGRELRRCARCYRTYDGLVGLYPNNRLPASDSGVGIEV
jgi:hypothetical protein